MDLLCFNCLHDYFQKVDKHNESRSDCGSQTSKTDQIAVTETSYKYEFG
jgi:hypothetical protein